MKIAVSLRTQTVKWFFKFSVFSLLGNTLTNNTVEAAAVQQTAIGVYSCRDVLYQHRVKTSNNARQSPVIDGSVVSGSIDINIDTFLFLYIGSHVRFTNTRQKTIDWPHNNCKLSLTYLARWLGSYQQVGQVDIVDVPVLPTQVGVAESTYLRPWSRHRQSVVTVSTRFVSSRQLRPAVRSL